MNVKVTWVDSYQRLLLLDYAYTWTSEESERAKTQAHQMIDEAAHDGAINVFIRVDDRCVVPPNAISHMRRCVQTRHPRTERMFLICQSQYLVNMWQALVTAYPELAPVYMHAPTLEDACALLQ